jgi:drug/metabolite transporter (DMT)-like permease
MLKTKLTANLVMILATVFWGSTFIITKILIQNVPVFLFLGIRYLFALIGFAPFFLRLKKINKKIIYMAVLTGLPYFLAIIFQTFGLQTTTAGKSGFITALYSIFVPIIAWLLFKKQIQRKIWIAVPISIVGVALLTLQGEFGIVVGDFLTLICAVLTALMIVLTDQFVNLVDIYAFSILEIILLTGLSFSLSILIDPPYDLLLEPPSFWVIMIYMGFFTTTLTFLFQNWGQKYQEPAQAALIFALEPIFALFFSFLIGNEILNWQGILGCGLIFLAILIAVIRPSNQKKFSKLKTIKTNGYVQDI